MITIINGAPLVAPVYNPIYIEVSSDQTAQEGFSFVFDVYVNGIFASREKLQPRPGTNTCVYSPAAVLRSYVSYDLSQDTVGAVTSINCIDFYTIQVGEEYVQYWTYYDNASGTGGNAELYSLSQSHFFSIGDQVLVQQFPGFSFPGYNGVHKVIDVPDNLTILINVPHISTPVNGGKVCYADKRKSIFFNASQAINNNTLLFANGQWSSYGPDGCGVTAGLVNTNKLRVKVPDTSCATGIQLITNTAVLTSGTTYRVTFTVSDIFNPSNAPIYIQAYCGGVVSAAVSTIGTYTFDITCGVVNTDFGMYFDLDSADTAGFGSHSAAVSYVSVVDVADLIGGYDFNGVVSYEEYPTWDYNQYVLNGVTLGKFLTKSPRRLKTMLDERGSLGVMQIIDPQSIAPGIGFTLHIDVKDIFGVTTNYIYPVTVLDSSAFTNEKYVHIGAYPWNINQFSTLNGDGNIIDTTTVSYDLYINAVLGAYDVPVSETFTFQLYANCGKYQPIRFMFLNSLGSFDYYTSTLLNRTSVNTQRDTYKRTLGYGYSVGDRGTTILNVNSFESFITNTDWITEDTCKWLAYELQNSKEVYILENNIPIPIVITNPTMEPKKRANDSLLNLQITFNKAVNLNTQTS